MKFEINTSAKNVEKANFMLAQAIKTLGNDPEFMRAHGVTEQDIEKAAMFRRSMVKAFLREGRRPR